MTNFLAWLRDNAVGLFTSFVFLAALAAVSAGAAMERESLGLIIPGGIVLAGMLARHFLNPRQPD